MKVLILTVGTTREPLEVALSEHAPEGVVFLASQASHPVAAELLRDYGASFRHHTLLLEDGGGAASVPSGARRGLGACANATSSWPKRGALAQERGLPGHQAPPGLAPGPRCATIPQGGGR